MRAGLYTELSEAGFFIFRVKLLAPTQHEVLSLDPCAFDISLAVNSDQHQAAAVCQDAVAKPDQNEWKEDLGVAIQYQ